MPRPNTSKGRLEGRLNNNSTPFSSNINNDDNKNNNDNNDDAVISRKGILNNDNRDSGGMLEKSGRKKEGVRLPLAAVGVSGGEGRGRGGHTSTRRLSVGIHTCIYTCIHIYTYSLPLSFSLSSLLSLSFGIAAIDKEFNKTHSSPLIPYINVDEVQNILKTESQKTTYNNVVNKLGLKPFSASVASKPVKKNKKNSSVPPLYKQASIHTITAGEINAKNNTSQKKILNQLSTLMVTALNNNNYPIRAGFDPCREYERTGKCFWWENHKRCNFDHDPKSLPEHLKPLGSTTWKSSKAKRNLNGDMEYKNKEERLAERNQYKLQYEAAVVIQTLLRKYIALRQFRRKKYVINIWLNNKKLIVNRFLISVMHKRRLRKREDSINNLKYRCMRTTSAIIIQRFLRKRTKERAERQKLVEKVTSKTNKYFPVRRWTS